jgi:hypothetical protein
MTEAEWLASEDARAMLEGASDNLRTLGGVERKLRLFAILCCNRDWDHIKYDERLRTAVQNTEQYTAGLLSETDWREACLEVERNHYLTGMWNYNARAAMWCMFPDRGSGARELSNYLSRTITRNAAPAFLAGSVGERAVQSAHANFLREIVGNPFRPVTLDQSWRTSTVVALAKGIYAERTFDVLPILSDALMDAGCENADLLDHCRDPQLTHVRGCWAVDLVLGKS